MKLILSLLIFLLSIPVFPDESLCDMDLFHKYRESFIEGNADSNQKDKIKSEMWRRLTENHTRELEDAILSEIKKNDKKENMVSLVSLTEYFAYEEILDEIANLIDRDYFINHNIKEKILIQNLSILKYEKALPVIIRKAFTSEDYNFNGVKDVSMKSVAMIGKSGVDYLLNELDKIKTNDEDVITSFGLSTIIYLLGYSSDSRVFDHVNEYVDSEDETIRSFAILTLARIGGLYPEELKKNYRSMRAKHHDNKVFEPVDDLSEEKRNEIKNILINSLNDLSRFIRETAAEYLRYYPGKDVIDDLENCDNDPYKTKQMIPSLGEKDYYPVREKAKESLGFLEKYYPELFDKKANQDGFQARFK